MATNLNLRNGEQYLRDLSERIGHGMVIRAGWFADSAPYKDGVPVARVALIQEKGAGHIPPRPFLHPAVRRNQATWKAMFREGIMHKGESMESIANKIGGQIVADIQNAINAVTSPELAESTKMARLRRYSASRKIGDLRFGSQAERDRKRARRANLISRLKSKGTYGGLMHPLIDTGHLIASVSFKAEVR